MKLCLE
jgi:predicted unusual protein kinase regulating ubiquinone biosynthesis (AarF/ABC1/UbiB family)